MTLKGSHRAKLSHSPHSLDELQELAGKFHGVIEQMPPPFSAKKIQGSARLQARTQEARGGSQHGAGRNQGIRNRLTVEDSCASFRARVASGTYLRSVAHDLGKLAGCGAHLKSLRRTAVAEFTLEDAHTLDQQQPLCRAGNWKLLLSTLASFCRLCLR